MLTWHLKRSNKFFNNILMAMSASMAFCQTLKIFCLLASGKDYFKNNFLFLGMTLVTKSIQGPKWELTQNIRIKVHFRLDFYLSIPPLPKSSVFLYHVKSYSRNMTTIARAKLRQMLQNSRRIISLLTKLKYKKKGKIGKNCKIMSHPKLKR